jgi:hypothetical protein
MLRTWGGDIAHAESGRYYIGCYLQRGMEIASMWGRFVAFKEGDLISEIKDLISDI